MMDLSMVGIDYEKASIEQREAFAFTKNQAKQAMTEWKRDASLSGCLLLSTCNRTELWISDPAGETDPFALLCSAKGILPKSCDSLAVRRRGREAAAHLLQLTCGLKSRIYGEDQILSQVREALEHSRKWDCDDRVIEKTFQTAIAAGKRVKSQVKLETADPSAARNVLLVLKKELGTLENTPCLIIGNGQMGRLVANTLREAGAQVTMTLRKRIHGKENRDSIIPEGCRMIDYEDRLAEIEQYRAVISATLSPHFTILKESLEGRTFQTAVWIDMAVPRDMDPRIGEISEIQLYDMDRLGDAGKKRANQKSLDQAMNILDDYQQELEKWFAFREHIDQVKSISDITARDACKRLEKDGEHDIFQVQGAACRAVEKLLFGIRDTLPQAQWQLCLSALDQSAQRDTLKTGKAKQRGDR